MKSELLVNAGFPLVENGKLLKSFLKERTVIPVFGKKDVMVEDRFGDDLVLIEGQYLEDPEKIPFRTDANYIALCIDGSYKQKVGLHTFTLTRGTVQLVKAGMPLMFWDVSHDFKCYCICFRSSFLSNLTLSTAAVDQLLELNPSEAPVLQLDESAYEEMLIHFSQVNEVYNDGEKSHGREILQLRILEMIYHIKSMMPPVAHVQTSHTSRYSQLIFDFRALVEEHFADRMPLSEYARLLHVTPKYLSHITRKELGDTAINLLHKRIIQEAEYLLYYTGYTVKEMADMLHFDSPTHFSRFFRLKTGKTPVEYRKLKHFQV
ncbi:MAG TPA: AraC family transcriptional regulator [Chitinophaga sp.]|uniref:helix-turn-helix domain-containing protein n=1 Tax=Chitinophaga sp. TaxID=1869181 RepID=UPI002CB6DE8D|nr:AraC family transcriptional regulator [Chitinophaga sp.]HVI47111.1 AraC family transcriptional regulator [Chitinophaga sp.]